MKLSREQVNRYARQIILSEIGVIGQKKLLDSKVLIIGLGGLGSSCAIYLAAAGIGNIGIVDFDKVGLNNLQRQIIHSESYVNKPKVESARNRIKELNSYVKVTTYDIKLTSDNALDIISNYDIVADCTDNFPSRYLVNDACILANKPFAHAAILQFYGQAITILPNKSACYRCFLPDPPSPDSISSCEEAGVIGTVVGIMGIIQANEIIKYILGIGELLNGKLLIFDSLDSSFEKILIKKNSKCEICGKHPTITDLTKNQEFYCNK
jgi:molybdopterin/thiamine biosynthesis adenylyltransferase